MIGEFGNGIDHAKRLDDLLHFVEITNLGLQRGEEAKSDVSGGGVCLIDVHVGANLAGDHRAVCVAWAMPREVDQVSSSGCANVVADRAGRRRKLNPKLFDSVFCRHEVSLDLVLFTILLLLFSRCFCLRPGRNIKHISDWGLKEKEDYRGGEKKPSPGEKDDFVTPRLIEYPTCSDRRDE